jgi:hypothetical protein
MDSINIVDPDNSFDFKNVSLGTLTTIPGGSYFSRLYFNNKPFYIQSPKSSTKQGFIKSGKKQYCDLMFTNNDEMFVHWIENLETTCQQLLFEKNDAWFTSENKLDLHEIESSFTSPLKLFKSGRFYLVRTNIKPNIKIYNDNTQVSIDSVTTDTCMVSVIEVQGIKFTSKNFQIELEIKQCLVVSPDPFLDNCLIKKPLVKTIDNDNANNANKIQQTTPTLAIVGTSVNSVNSVNTVIPSIEDDYEEILELSKQFLHNNGIKQSAVQVQSVDKTREHNPDKINSLNDLDISDTTDVKNETKLNTKLNAKTIMPPLKHLGSGSGSGSGSGVNVSISSSAINLSNVDLGAIELDTQDLGLTEVELTTDNSLETIVLKKPNQVYYEIYNEARKKAKECKKTAILAYLEAKNIKKTYMLDDLDNSDESDESDFEDLEVDGLKEFQDFEDFEE